MVRHAWKSWERITRSSGVKSRNPGILEKTLSGKGDLTFVWIPQNAGSFQLVLDVVSQNKKPFQITKSLKTVDLRTIIERSNFQVLKKCQFDKIR